VRKKSERNPQPLTSIDAHGYALRFAERLLATGSFSAVLGDLEE
jgi:hypothetical protein